MSSDIRKPQISLKKVLELINYFSKVAGNKINIPKLIVILHTNSKLYVIEIKKAYMYICVHTYMSGIRRDSMLASQAQGFESKTLVPPPKKNKDE
jgi:hypothetical protein